MESKEFEIKLKKKKTGKTETASQQQIRFQGINISKRITVLLVLPPFLPTGINNTNNHSRR